MRCVRQGNAMNLGAFRGWTSAQKHVVAASFLGWMLDAFDFFLLIFVIPDIARDFHVGVAAVSVAVTGCLHGRNRACASGALHPTPRSRVAGLEGFAGAHCGDIRGVREELAPRALLHSAHDLSQLSQSWHAGPLPDIPEGGASSGSTCDPLHCRDL